MGACSSEETAIEEPSLDNEIMEIVAKMGILQTESTTSRTTINMGEFESDFISLVWADKDTIGIYPTIGDQLSFPITEGIGTNTCTFNGGGWALKTSTSYTAYSPFNRANYYNDVTKLPVSMLGQKQTGNGSATHLGKYDLQTAKGKTPDNGKITFDFEHQVCFIRMDLKAPIAETWKSITLKSDGEFTTEATMDLTKDVPVVTPTSTANSVTLELEDVTTTTDNLSITAYMVVLPADLREKTLEVELTDSKDHVYTTEATIAHDYRNFKAGYARWIKAESNGIYKDGVAYINKAGYLESILDEDCLNITSLKVVGPINGTDISCLRQMLGGSDFDENQWGKLTTLDLSEATIVEGGDSYSGQNNTSNNKIGDYMFSGRTNLQNITLPNNATSIGIGAFSSCSSLNSVTIGKNVTLIDRIAFSSCNALISIDIPDNVTSIGNDAFSACSSLASVTIGKGVKTINSNAFYDCDALTSINIPDNVVNIYANAFDDCSALETATIGKGVTLIGSGAFNYCKALTSINIPDGITTIGSGAFRNCSSLTSINIPDGVKTIDAYTFYGCSSLASVTIGKGVKTIGNEAFYDCEALTSINIPDNVTSIGQETFMHCSSLSSINIGKGITSIYKLAFYGCTSLTSVYITDLSAWCNITFNDSDSNPLSNGSKLYIGNKELIIPEGITKIKDYAFYHCTSLNKVSIGNLVTSIGYSTFSNCSSLIECDCYATTPPTLNKNNYSFYNIKQGATLYVPKECVDEYISSDWNTYFNEIKEMEE